MDNRDLQRDLQRDLWREEVDEGEDKSRTAAVHGWEMRNAWRTSILVPRQQRCVALNEEVNDLHAVGEERSSLRSVEEGWSSLRAVKGRRDNLHGLETREPHVRLFSPSCCVSGDSLLVERMG
jgi:hypothetical protein